MACIRYDQYDPLIHDIISVHNTQSDCIENCGVCCVNGICIDTSQTACENANGIWYSGATCEDVICPSPSPSVSLSISPSVSPSVPLGGVCCVPNCIGNVTIPYTDPNFGDFIVWEPFLRNDTQYVSLKDCGEQGDDSGTFDLFPLNVTTAVPGTPATERGICNLDNYDDVGFEKRNGSYIGEPTGGGIQDDDTIGFIVYDRPCREDQGCANVKHTKWQRAWDETKQDIYGALFPFFVDGINGQWDSAYLHQVQRIRGHGGFGSLPGSSNVNYNRGDSNIPGIVIRPFYAGSSPIPIDTDELGGITTVFWADNFPKTGGILELRYFEATYHNHQNSVASNNSKYIIESDGAIPVVQDRVWYKCDPYVGGEFPYPATELADTPLFGAPFTWRRFSLSLKYFDCENGIMIDRTAEAFTNANDPKTYTPPTDERQFPGSFTPTPVNVGTATNFSFNTWAMHGICNLLVETWKDCEAASFPASVETFLCDGSLYSAGVNDWTPEELAWVNDIEFYPSIPDITVTGHGMVYSCNGTLTEEGCLSGGEINPAGIKLGTWYGGQNCNTFDCNS